MKVIRLTLWSDDLPCHKPYNRAERKTCDTVKSHALCQDTDTGLKHCGDICPITSYLPAFANGLPSAIAELTPEIRCVAQYLRTIVFHVGSRPPNRPGLGLTPYPDVLGKPLLELD